MVVFAIWYLKYIQNNHVPNRFSVKNLQYRRLKWWEQKHTCSMHDSNPHAPRKKNIYRIYYKHVNVKINPGQQPPVKFSNSREDQTQINIMIYISSILFKLSKSSEFLWISRYFSNLQIFQNQLNLWGSGFHNLHLTFVVSLILQKSHPCPKTTPGSCNQTPGIFAPAKKLHRAFVKKNTTEIPYKPGWWKKRSPSDQFHNSLLPQKKKQPLIKRRSRNKKWLEKNHPIWRKGKPSSKVPAGRRTLL